MEARMRVLFSLFSWFLRQNSYSCTMLLVVRPCTRQYQLRISKISWSLLSILGLRLLWLEFLISVRLTLKAFCDLSGRESALRLSLAWQYVLRSFTFFQSEQMMVLMMFEEAGLRVRQAPPEDCGLSFLGGQRGLTEHLCLIMFNLQRIYIIQIMGSSQHSSQLAEFAIDHCSGNLSLLTKRANGEKYLMKTYAAASKEELVAKLRYFKEYRSNMEGNQEVSRLVQILEEKDEHFCSTSHRLHLIFEHSSLSVAEEVRQRRQAMRSGSPHSKYFNYEDLCNILYSCLSALWFSEQMLPDCPDHQLSRYGTVFLSTHNMLIFGEGVLKIMDPLVVDFRSRYTYHPNVYYSPEKLTDFAFPDDQKCAIFQLAMALLEIALLEPVSEAYKGHEYLEEVTAKKLERARQIYCSDIEDSLSVSVFDLVEKMVETDREERFTLEEAIAYAEQMYEVQESLAQEASPSHPTHFCPVSTLDSEKRGASQHRTAHSSPKRSKFYDFRNSTLCDREESVVSPRVGNFTIHEVEPEREEQSSMLESLTVNNMPMGISESVVEGGIFSTINIADTYNYAHKFNSSLKQENLFTDPALLRTINRELREIEERKKHRLNDSLLCSGSRVIEKRERFECKDIDSNLKITNTAYLR